MLFTYLCIWRTDVNIKCFPQSLSILLFEAVSLTDLASSAGQTDQ